MEDTPEQKQIVILSLDDSGLEEREGHLVASAVDDAVYALTAPILD